MATTIFSWVVENRIDVILSENASALPVPPLHGPRHQDRGREHESLPVVTHDHDFAWERGDRYASRRFRKSPS